MTEEQLQAVYDSQATEEKRALLKKRLKEGVSQADLDFAEARVAEVLDRMEDQLQDRPWVCGSELTLADISVAPFI